MARRGVVLFLGAGASVPFGYPTTDGILSAIRHAIRLGMSRRERPPWLLNQESKHPNIRSQLRRGLRLILPGMRAGKSAKHASIIDVLSILDYLINAGLSLAPDFREPELRTMRQQLGLCMYGVLRGQQRLAIRDKLLRWILKTERAGTRVSIVTTNYDCVYDIRLAHELNKRGRNVFKSVDFGTTVLRPDSHEFPRPEAAKLGVFKLHGSLNWLQCEVCGSLYVNPRQRIASLADWTRATRWNTCKCNGRLREVLVAPSLVRDIRNTHLLSTWNAALCDLREAGEWIFMGYSLPQEDIAIRALLLRALHGRTRKKLLVRVALWDRAEQRERDQSEIDSSDHDREKLFQEELARRTLQRYRDFLPRKHFKADTTDYFPKGVEEIVTHLGKCS